MTDEQVDKISGPAGNTVPTDPVPIDPTLFEREDVRRVLAALDIAALYRVLGDGAGISQRQIAARTGQSQSEVSDIVAGRRRVESHQVLVRIADGFDIPRELMGLSWWGPDGIYAGKVTVTEPPNEEGEDVRRRALIAATSMAALGQVLQGLGELTELALPAGEPLPSRLSMSHVHAVEAVTDRLRGLTRQFGGQSELFGVAAKHYRQWLEVAASDAVKARLGAALAELHTEAGWSCYDAGVDGTGYFTRALRVADEFGDAFGIANAACHAGVTLVRSRHPHSGLKCFQLGEFPLRGFQPGKSKPAILRGDGPRVPVLTAWLNRDSATAYALMGDFDQAKRYLAKAQDGWVPRNAFERAGADLTTAWILIDLHQFDTAERFAASAVRTYGEGHRRSRTMAELTLAELHNWKPGPAATRRTSPARPVNSPRRYPSLCRRVTTSADRKQGAQHVPSLLPAQLAPPGEVTGGP